MAVSVSDISSEIDRQIEEFLSQITEEQYQDFLNNSTQLLPKLDGSIDGGSKSLDGSSIDTTYCVCSIYGSSSTTTTAASSSKISASSRFAAPKDDEAVLAAQKSAIPETTKKALTGLAEFENSGASAGNNLIVHTHHHLTYAVIRVPLIAG
uniref:Uncharacterized protein n=1 Tax=Amphimedon queenslandica TaxID=400682 RepID=A0A1X7SPU9_AMPQE